jgi:cbb3-type cytochrome oxidase subunit 3
VQVERFRQDNEGRKVLRDAIFTVTVVWMLLVLLMVWQSGAGKIKLSDSVLITLITTTTANVFGFLYVVVNYLYNREKST